jgi:hypothetical protein
MWFCSPFSQTELHFSTVPFMGVRSDVWGRQSFPGSIPISYIPAPISHQPHQPDHRKSFEDVHWGIGIEILIKNQSSLSLTKDPAMLLLLNMRQRDTIQTVTAIKHDVKAGWL